MAAASEVVGRDAERAQAATVLSRCSQGTGALLLIDGEAGIGKSTLVGEITRLAAESAFEVMTAAGVEFEKSFPFGMVTRMLRSSDAGGDVAVRQVFDVLVTAGGSQTESDVGFRVIERVADILEDRAIRHPMLVVAEDIQWADDLSLTTLCRVAERARQIPLVTVCTSRTRETRLEHVLSRVDHPPVSRISLEPLPDESVKVLVHTLLGADPGPNLTARLLGAGGNPLFVLELVAQLREDGKLTIKNEVAEIESTALPPSLRTMVLLRLSHLGPNVLEVLRTAAVLSSAVDGDELAAILGVGHVHVVRCLETARAEGVLAEYDGGLRFRHDLIREALYDDLPSSVRKTLHGQIARVLVERDADPGRVATHLVLGSSPGDVDAARAMVTTSVRLAPASAREASALLDRAAAIAPSGSQLRHQALAERAWISTWSGAPAEGERVARDLLNDAVAPDVRSRAASALVRALMLQGRFNDLRPQLGRVMDDSSIPAAARSELVAEAALIASGPPSQHGYATTLAEHVLGSADASTTAACLALCALSYLRNFRGDVDSSVEMAREALDLATSSQASDALRRAPHYYLGGTLMYVDELQEAEALFRAGTAVAERLGAPWSLPVYHMLWGHLHLHAGRWDDAVAELHAASQLAKRLGTMLQVIPTLALRVVISLHRGERDAARDHLATMEALAASAPLAPYYVPWARALWAHAEGDRTTAHREAVLLHRVLRDTDHLFAYRIVGIDLVRLLLAAGDRTSAEEVAVILETLVPQHPSATPRASALWARAMVRRDPDLALAAVAEYRRGPRPVERAWAMEDAAVLLADRDKQVARQLLEEALTTYAETGLAHDVRRAESSLRAWGIRRGARVRHQRATTGWDALTETESRVGGLVAEGLSNPSIASRLFVSRRTVDAHLSHIYAKLGMCSRTQLAAEVVRRQQTG